MHLQRKEEYKMKPNECIIDEKKKKRIYVRGDESSAKPKPDPHRHPQRMLCCPSKLLTMCTTITATTIYISNSLNREREPRRNFLFKTYFWREKEKVAQQKVKKLLCGMPLVICTYEIKFIKHTELSAPTT